MRTLAFILLSGLAAVACGKKASEKRESSAGGDSAKSVPVAKQQASDIVAENVPHREVSNGTGGPTGTVTKTFQDSAGTGSEYTLVATGAAQPKGLLVFLHGSGNRDAYGTAMPWLQTVAEKFGLVPLAVRSADTDSWLKGGLKNLQFLDDLLQKEVLPKYNIDLDKIYFSGVSGGAVFLTGYFLPMVGYKYRGGMVCLCGGEVNIANSAYGPIYANNDLLNHMPVYFYTQTGDYMLHQVKGAEVFYREHGLKVYSSYPPGEGHCGFSAETVLSEHLAKMIPGSP